MKKTLLIAALSLFNFINAQQNKILVVENNLGKFQTYDKYNLNSYTKLFLEEEGYTVYHEKDLPIQISNNRCSANYVNYIEDSGLFTTGLKIIVKDCSGKIILESELGKSREKNYSTAYREAFLNSIKSFKQKKHLLINNQVSNVNPATKLDTTLPTTNELVFEFKNDGYEGEIKDQTNKVLYKITKTSIDNVYKASNPYVDGIIYTKEGKWYFEFIKNGEKIVEEIK